MIRNVWGASFLLGLACFVYFLLSARWWNAGACFLALGVLYALYEQQSDPFYRPRHYDFGVMFFKWPVRLYYRVTNLRARASHRYIVAGGNRFRPLVTNSGSEALAMAKKLANESGKTAYFMDTHMKDMLELNGDERGRMYHVEPDFP